MDAQAIRVAGVSKSFGRRRVLDGVDLRVSKGERLALVGPNGAGKTTLIRCLLGEYHCDGQVNVDDRSPRADRAAVLRTVGFVPQIPPPLAMPVGQLVRFAADLCEADAASIGRDAERLGLDAHALRRQPFRKLSGGQKQKLLIAIALRRGAELLVMDEPAANLDPEARHTFLELLAERDGRATMLISSHRLDEVAALVSRVVELDGGRVTLDEQVAGSGRVDARLHCHVALVRADESAAAALVAWGLRPEAAGTAFGGSIAGADRLRFLGMLARYSGLLSGLRLEEVPGEAGDRCDA